MPNSNLKDLDKEIIDAIEKVKRALREKKLTILDLMDWLSFQPEHLLEALGRLILQGKVSMEDLVVLENMFDNMTLIEVEEIGELTGAKVQEEKVIFLDDIQELIPRVITLGLNKVLGTDFTRENMPALGLTLETIKWFVDAAGVKLKTKTPAVALICLFDKDNKGNPINLEYLARIKPGLFNNSAWVLGEEFAKTESLRKGWYLIFETINPWYTYKSPESQLAMAKQRGETVLTCVEELVIQLLTNGKRGYEVLTSSNCKEGPIAISNLEIVTAEKSLSERRGLAVAKTDFKESKKTS